VQTIGVLGGWGPHATIDFMEHLYRGQPAEGEQGYVRAIIDCNPRFPSRDRMSPETRALCSAGLADMARKLEQSGAAFIVMPCNTGHIFKADIEQAISCPFVSIITTTVDEVARVAPGAAAVGLLATRSCLEAGLYQAELESRGLRAVTLPPSEMDDFMALIGRIKVGQRGEREVEEMRRYGDKLIGLGAEVLIAGCTEVPLVVSPTTFARPLVDSCAALAAVALDLAAAPSPTQA